MVLHTTLLLTFTAINPHVGTTGIEHNFECIVCVSDSHLSSVLKVLKVSHVDSLIALACFLIRRSNNKSTKNDTGL